MDNWNTKQRVIVQVVCVLLSIILWVYVTNIENPLNTIELNKVNVQLLNSDILAESGQILAPNQDITVSLKLEGSIQDIYKVSAADFSAVIDLQPYALKIGENTIPVTIIDSPSNITIKNLSGLTATIVVEELTEKEVPVISDIDVTVKNSYYASAAETDPETITVSGPKSLVDRVDSVEVSGSEDNVDQTIVKNYDIYAVDVNRNKVAGVSFSQDTVQVTIRVNEGKTVPINVVTEGKLPDGLRLINTEVKEKSIDISGPDGVLSNISEIDTEAIDLSKITEDTSIEVGVIIPEGAVNESSKTVTVDISLERTETKEIEVPFTVQGLSEDFNSVIDTDKVKVTIRGYSKNLEGITAADLTAVLDLTSINAEGDYTLKPAVTIINGSESVIISNIGDIKVNITKQKADNTASTEEDSEPASGSDVDNNENGNAEDTNQ